MHTRSLALALIATLLLAFGAFAAGCGGEDSLTLEQYFQQLEALNDTVEEQGAEFADAANAELDAATSEEDILAVSEDFLTNVQPIFTTFADDLNDLNPPAAVEELHNEFVDVYNEVVVYLEEALNRFGDLDSTADLEGFFEEIGSNVGERLDETCAALQTIADENEIDIDLDC